MLSGIPLVVSKSPVFGKLLSVDRMYLGLALPKSHIERHYLKKLKLIILTRNNLEELDNLLD